MRTAWEKTRWDWVGRGGHEAETSPVAKKTSGARKGENKRRGKAKNSEL